MLTAGPETDRRVAEALGLRLVEIAGFVDVEGGWLDGAVEVFDGERSLGYLDHDWCPSTDANDALWAAEKANFPYSVGRTMGDRLYFLVSAVPAVGEHYAKTLPLAICAAILALKGEAHSGGGNVSSPPV